MRKREKWVTRATIAASVAVSLAVTAAPAPAAFPGTNGKIAFTSNRDGNFEVYVMNADGSDQTRLTSSAGSNGDPAWSPDGQRIAFTSTRDGIREIYVMNVDGSAQTRITASGGFNEQQPTWLPDGEKIAFASDGNIYEISRVGGARTQLTFDSFEGERDSAPASPPTGRSIAFTRIAFVDELEQPPAIHTLSFGEVTSLGSESNWAPTGLKIVYTNVHELGGPYGLSTVNPDGSGNQVLLGDVGCPCVPAWAPDGQKIVYGNLGNLYTVNADGTQPYTPLTSGTSYNADPDWQPLPHADLGLTSSHAPEPVFVGERLTYTMTARNHGPARATGVVLTDRLPKGVRLRSARTDRGRCVLRGSSRVHCNLGDLGSSELASVSIVARARRAGIISNVVSVSADQIDPVSSNNSATEMTTVLTPLLP